MGDPPLPPDPGETDPEKLAAWRRAVAEAVKDEVYAKQPRLLEALWADAAMYSGLLTGRAQFKTMPEFLRQVARLSWESDAFFCLVLYRVRTRLTVRGVPLLPRLLHHLCIAIGQVSIGEGTVLHPGVYLPHGQVVIDGVVEVGSGTVISPFVVMGRTGPALHGPTIADDVFIGAGAKLLGPVKIGTQALVAANAVVVSDVKSYTSVGGVPAKMIKNRRDTPEYQAIAAAVKQRRAEAAAEAAAAEAAAAERAASGNDEAARDAAPDRASKPNGAGGSEPGPGS